MTSSCGLMMFNSSGFKSSLAIGVGCPKLPIRCSNRGDYGFRKFNCGDALLGLRKTPVFQIEYFDQRRSGTSHVSSAGRNYRLGYTDDSRSEPFLLNMMRETIWSARSLLLFLVEQPSQLKYIEWPSFHSTLKTATLTLVLVAFLIVALSSVDSALSFLLALLLRRKV